MKRQRKGHPGKEKSKRHLCIFFYLLPTPTSFNLYSLEKYFKNLLTSVHDTKHNTNYNISCPGIKFPTNLPLTWFWKLVKEQYIQYLCTEKSVMVKLTWRASDGW